MSVIGMQPSRMPASEAMTIIMNTMPDAPMSIEPGNRNQYTSPDTSAVMTIALKRLRLPYFSSSPGPTTRIIIILPM